MLNRYNNLQQKTFVFNNQNQINQYINNLHKQKLPPSQLQQNLTTLNNSQPTHWAAGEITNFPITMKLFILKEIKNDKK